MEGTIDERPWSFVVIKRVRRLEITENLQFSLVTRHRERYRARAIALDVLSRRRALHEVAKRRSRSTSRDS